MTNEASLLDEGMRARLAFFYAAEDRHYHSMAHIEDLLSLAASHADLVSDGPAVEAAIWFHDAILDTHRNDNEARSARMAEEWLADRASPERVASIARMIEATATHALPDGASAELGADIALFLDFDLSILGASPERFDAYEEAVRREYAWVPEEAWRSGRAQVLGRFLDRPWIYATERFRALHEESARANIARSLARLALSNSRKGM